MWRFLKDPPFPGPFGFWTWIWLLWCVTWTSHPWSNSLEWPWWAVVLHLVLWTFNFGILMLTMYTRGRTREMEDRFEDDRRLLRAAMRAGTNEGGVNR